MEGDWWWPWWVTTAVGVAVALVGFAVFLRSSERRVRRLLVPVIVVALAAAALAPVIMRDSDGEKPEPDMNEQPVPGQRMNTDTSMSG
jgi:hypothetical protein